MNLFKIRILLKTIPFAILIVIVKMYVISSLIIFNTPLNNLIEISDLSAVFTGAFFVMALMLTGTMTDFKESEKIPGEVASNFEAIQDWAILAFKAPRTGSNELSKEALNKDYIHKTLSDVSIGMKNWFESPQKDSFIIFPLIRKLNDISYYFAERGVDKEAVKGIQENTNAMRKQVSRAYAISKTTFLSSAYVLLLGILSFVVILLLITKFKTTSAEIMVTLFISFVFIYLYQLILTLDDPFMSYKGKTAVELRPLERFIERLGNDFFKFNI